ncbi:MAG: murein L,D-transpeptidase catalytic domain family protein [Prevotellaceae bacterium]|nr:murein L,D-transpeptidase catalytic domain family protein [Prevotellaceae bacterium]
MNTKRKFLIGFACILALIVYNRFMVSCKKPSSVTIDSVIKRLPSDARYLCIVNFGKHSGEERFFIYNVKKKKFEYSGLVQHGNGKGNTAGKPKFSNVIGSNCSSLGLYKITSKDKMHSWPNAPCLRMIGLDSTNSNAMSRGILIHPSLTRTLMPFEIWGLDLPLTWESQGCFAVSCNTMYEISKRFNKNNMYLYAYV